MMDTLLKGRNQNSENEHTLNKAMSGLLQKISINASTGCESSLAMLSKFNLVAMLPIV